MALSNTIPDQLEPRIITDALQILVNRNPMLAMLNKDYSAAAGQLGASVSVPVVSSGTVGNATYSMTPPTPSDSTITNAPITIDQHKAISFGFTNAEIQKYLLNGSIPRILEQRIADLSDYIAGYIWDKFDAAVIAETIGKATSWGASIDALADVDKQLTAQKVGRANRVGLLNLTTAVTLKKIDSLQKWNERGGGVTLEEGEIGKLMGLRLFEDANVDADNSARNIFGDLAGFGMVMRLPANDIYDGMTLGVKTAASDPVTGIPLRLTRTPGHNMCSWTLDVMFGGAVLNGNFFYGATTASTWTSGS